MEIRVGAYSPIDDLLELQGLLYYPWSYTCQDILQTIDRGKTEAQSPNQIGWPRGAEVAFNSFDAELISHRILFTRSPFGDRLLQLLVTWAVLASNLFGFRRGSWLFNLAR